MLLDQAAQEKEDERKLASDILDLFAAHQNAYATEQGTADARAYNYTQSRQWMQGAGALMADNTEQGATPRLPEWDETYPIMDAVSSVLAIRTPNVSALDKAYGVELDADKRKQAERYARVLNWHAEKGGYGKIARRMVRYGMTFATGATLLVEPDAEAGHVKWSLLKPYENFLDQSADTVPKIEYAYRMFAMPWRTFKRNVHAGYYADAPEVEIGNASRPTRPDRRYAQDQTARAMRPAAVQSVESARANLFPTVTIVEFWNFGEGWYAHLAPETGRLLMKRPLPYGNAWVRMLLDAGQNDMEQVAFVARVVEVQRIINDLTQAKVQIATCNHTRTFMDERLMKGDPKIIEKTLNAKVNDVIRVSGIDDSSGKLTDFIVPVTPAQITPAQTQVHAELIEHIRYIAGIDQFPDAQNIRTAEEVEQMVQSSSARSLARANQLDDAMLELFQHTGRVYRWMLEAREEIGYDPTACWQDTNPDISLDEFIQLCIEGSEHYKLEPFGSLKEDAVTRRSALLKLMPILTNPALLQNVDARALIEEVIRLFRLAPDIIKSKEDLEAEQAAAQAQGAPGAAPEAPPPGELPAPSPPLPPGATDALAALAAPSPAGTPPVPTPPSLPPAPSNSPF